MKSIRDSSILVVDDDKRLLRAIERVLSNEGCKVACASWAAEAMERLANPQNRFDLVITDLHMPFVKGASIVWMIAQRLNAETARVTSAVEGKATAPGTAAAIPRLPVIVLTAFGSPEVRAECFYLGVADFLEKPLNTRQLLAAIDKVFALPNQP